MKRIFSIFCLVLVLSCSVPFCAEALTVHLNNDVVQSMLESALKNGFSPHKDVQALLDDALLNGYDYCTVERNEKSGAFVIKVAIEGLSSALKALDNSKSPESLETLSQAKEAIISHGKAVFDLFKTVGREDIAFIFYLIDDEPLYEYNIAEHKLMIITFLNGEERIISTSIDAWKEKDAN